MWQKLVYAVAPVIALTALGTALAMWREQPVLEQGIQENTRRIGQLEVKHDEDRKALEARFDEQDRRQDKRHDEVMNHLIQIQRDLRK